MTPQTLRILYHLGISRARFTVRPAWSSFHGSRIKTKSNSNTNTTDSPNLIGALHRLYLVSLGIKLLDTTRKGR